jgi:hypothetical protein
MTDEITEIRQQIQQMRQQPGSRVTHGGRVTTEPSQKFDGIEPREIGRTFDLQIAHLSSKHPRKSYRGHSSSDSVNQCGDEAARKLGKSKSYRGARPG